MKHYDWLAILAAVAVVVLGLVSGLLIGWLIWHG